MTLRALAGAMLLLAALTTSCAPQSASLEFTIEQALATVPQGADLGRVIEGEWDRICIFRPPTPVVRVDSVLGARWPGAADTGIASGEDATLIVFAAGARVVRHVMYPRAKGDFGTPGPEQWYCLPRSQAVFELRQPIDGSIPWIGPARGR
jgi:hypothetical protein